MAIPATPSNLISQTGNMQNYLSWDIVAGATSYDVQRSLDGVTFASVSTPVINNYLDTAVTVGVQYFYKVASVNGSGTSPYTTAQSLIPAPTGEMSLAQLRLSSQQKADKVNSQFVTVPEWNTFINLAMNELYDLLITSFEDYFVLSPVSFNSDGTTYLYPLPDGITQFTDIQGNSIAARPFYKLCGVDLGLNSATNGFVTINKFNFIDRNRYVYPNTASTIYGVFNLQYRLVGDKIEFIPTPSAGQQIRIWYIPRLQQLLKDTDLTTIGFSGWLNYVIVRAAKYAVDKEEGDSSVLSQELIFLRQRIEETAMNRDVGQGDKISDTRTASWWSNTSGGGLGGGYSGW